MPYPQPKKITQTKTTSLVPCIRKPVNTVVWRRNPLDPYLYISFSQTQWLKAYGSRDKDLAAICVQGKEFTVEVIKAFKRLIDIEWVTRAKLPIKYLAIDESTQNIRKKNVVWIISKGLSEEQEAIISHGKIIELQVESHVPGEYKIVFFQDLVSAALTPKLIYHFLHETAHALIGLKHFRAYNEFDSDLPMPYCRGSQYKEESLDCTRTVMAYTDDCPPVKRKEIELLGATSVSIYDPKPGVQKKVKKIHAAYPTKLGDVDLKAAQQFKKEWKEINEQVSLELQDAQPNAKRLHVDLGVHKAILGNMIQSVNQSMSSFIFAGMDYIVTSISNACLKLGRNLEACDHYFPKQSSLDAPSYYTTNSPLLFFNAKTGSRDIDVSSYTPVNIPITPENAKLAFDTPR